MNKKDIIIHCNTPDGPLWRRKTAEDKLMEELYKNEKRPKAICRKCGEKILGDENSLCGNCAGEL